MSRFTDQGCRWGGVAVALLEALGFEKAFSIGGLNALLERETGGSMLGGDLGERVYSLRNI